jgi:hypothetical protein
LYGCQSNSVITNAYGRGLALHNRKLATMLAQKMPRLAARAILFVMSATGWRRDGMAFAVDLAS